MLSVIMKILLDNSLCVLSTCRNDTPNASLMQYICDDDCTKLYMLTLKESTKYLNIINNSNISVLVDTRDSKHNNSAQINAITIYGNARIVDNKDTSKELIDLFKIKYTNLLSLASNKNVCVIEISIKSFLFLEGADKSHYVSLLKQIL